MLTAAAPSWDTVPVVSPSDVAVALVIAVVLVFVARRSRSTVRPTNSVATAGDQGTTGLDEPPDADPEIELIIAK